MDNIMIALQDIRKIYHIGSQDFAALAGITLQIKEGEFAALMGPSGSGKSTLMNILGCLDRPTSGSYKLGGKEVAHLSDDELAVTRNKSIGFVFQNFNLLGKISALDNVALPLVYAGVGKKERTERAMEKLRAVGLETWSHHKPHIIMADEPTGNLDTKSTREIMDIFEDLHSQKKTVILVTHEPEIAARASRQLLLSDGLITKDAGKGVVMDVI